MSEPWDTYIREYSPINHCDVCDRPDYLVCVTVSGIETWVCDECRNPPVFGQLGRDASGDDGNLPDPEEKYAADAQEALDKEFGR